MSEIILSNDEIKNNWKFTRETKSQLRNKKNLDQYLINQKQSRLKDEIKKKKKLQNRQRQKSQIKRIELTLKFMELSGLLLNFKGSISKKKAREKKNRKTNIVRKKPPTNTKHSSYSIEKDVEIAMTQK